MTATANLARLVENLEAENSLPIDERTSGASDEGLTWAVEKATRARELFDEGQIDAAALLIDEVVRRAVDTWALTAPLVDQIANCSRVLRESRRGPKC